MYKWRLLQEYKINYTKFGGEGAENVCASWLYVNLTQATLTLEEGTSIEKCPPSN